MKNKLFWLLLPAIIVMMLILAPAAVQAQTGKFSLSLMVVSPYPNTVSRGQSSHFLVEVTNTDSEMLNNIRLSSSADGDWRVEFQPAGLDALAAGSAKIIDVNITPGNGMGNGNYNATLIARADETGSVTSIFLQVQGGASIWWWVGLAMGVITIGVFVFVFLRFGRR